MQGSKVVDPFVNLGSRASRASTPAIPPEHFPGATSGPHFPAVVASFRVAVTLNYNHGDD